MAQYQSKAPAALAEFNYIFEREIAWGDMDAMNHVNNTRYLHFCESARIEFLRTQSSWLADESPSQHITEGLALAEVACKFKAPVVYPDTLLIGLCIENIESTSFEIHHHLYSQRLEKVAAFSTAKMVVYDFAKLQRIELTKEQIAFLHRFSLNKK